MSQYTKFQKSIKVKLQLFINSQFLSLHQKYILFYHPLNTEAYIQLPQ